MNTAFKALSFSSAPLFDWRAKAFSSAFCFSYWILYSSICLMFIDASMFLFIISFSFSIFLHLFSFSLFFKPNGSFLYFFVFYLFFDLLLIINVSLKHLKVSFFLVRLLNFTSSISFVTRCILKIYQSCPLVLITLTIYRNLPHSVLVINSVRWDFVKGPRLRNRRCSLRCWIFW